MVKDTEKPVKPTNKKVHQIRFTDLQWAALSADAAKDGIGVSELLRRIIDIHIVRMELDERFISAVARLERRVDAIEKVIIKA